MVTAGGVPCIGNANYRGTLFGGYGAYAIGQADYRFTASGNTLTIDEQNRGGTNETENIAVTAIYGLIRA